MSSPLEAPVGARPGAPGRTDFWSALEPADVAALRAAGSVRAFARGQALLYEQQLPDRVLVLRAGRVKMLRTTPAGREIVVAFAGPGEVIGELGALDGRPRSVSVVALEPVEALCLSVAAFHAFLEARPQACLALLRTLSGRLRDADAKLVDFARFGSLERVAARLLELCERFGEEDDDALAIALPLTQEELAAWSGSSVESVGRALATMRALKWIETRRRVIRVLDLDALRRAIDS